MSALQRLEREREKLVKNTLRSLRAKAPNVYKDLVLSLPPKIKAGLGAVDWGKIGTNILDAYVTSTQYKTVSEQERKSAEVELKKLQEQTRIMDAQIKLQKEQNKLASLTASAQMAGESLLDQLKSKPWALPLLGALGFGLFRSMSNRRGRR